MEAAAGGGGEKEEMEGGREERDWGVMECACAVSSLLVSEVMELMEAQREENTNKYKTHTNMRISFIKPVFIRDQ